jgi:uncharacterized protein YoxC
MGDEGTVTIVANVAVVILCVTVIYHSGRLSARVDALEAWRAELRDDLKSIRATVDMIAAVFKREVR